MTLSSSQTKADEPLKLPKPDLRNITVLTRKLPNIPILPWNHYDSPGLDAEPDVEIEPNTESHTAPDIALEAVPDMVPVEVETKLDLELDAAEVAQTADQ